MIQKAIEKAAVLIEAMPYIQRFRGDTVVVKFGGSILDKQKDYAHILRDLTFMEIIGMRPVLIHGGGKAISAELQSRGIKPRFEHGLRVTDAATVKVVDEVLNHGVNKELVGVLEEFGCKAVGIHGQDIIKVKKHTRMDEETGEELDWGFVGEVEKVNCDPIIEALDNLSVPVITPLGTGPDGQLYNINADEVAGAIARSLRARKLVFLSDVPGVLRDPDDKRTIMSTLNLEEVEQLIERKVIAGGMLPKVGGAIKALHAGVKKTHIIDSALQHSLLLELFTDQGVGTEIVH